MKVEMLDFFRMYVFVIRIQNNGGYTINTFTKSLTKLGIHAHNYAV